MSYQFRDVFFLDENLGFLGGGNHGMHEGEGHVFRTTDGGTSWEPVFGGMSRIVHFLQFLDAGTGFALTYDWSSEIHKTSDGGDSWERIHWQNTWDSLGYRFDCQDFHFLDEQRGWLAGQHEDHLTRTAAVMATTDGGQSWQLAWKDSTRYMLSDITFTPGGQIWAVGFDDLIVHRTDEGTWQAIIMNTERNLRDVFFVNDSCGWIAGGHADEYSPSPVLLRTFNGGAGWEKSDLDSFAIHDMHFFDRWHGWAVGQRDESTGILVETLDGGATWSEHPDYSGPPLHRVFFRDEKGWITGGGPDYSWSTSGILLYTDNGGATWIDPVTSTHYPAAFRLEQNYPNPFNSVTNIKFRISNSEFVTLEIYNTLGQKVATPVSGWYTAGRHQVSWDATALASGVYYYRMSTEAGFTKTKKLLLLK
jgi:photosystem II stability/assembly factor-like uncharacterized protein